MTVNGSGSAPEETPRQIAERELLAARDDVQQMAENMRARLKQDEQDQQDQQDQQNEQTAGE
ncbi:hypothetical protein [Kribbella soli]|uniref:Uncharacterized protein n=1 Tax=Kribbella soli TaxID=1124743 RepID=A0A4R0HDW8_9ACTN|nr:hypothetical protein [Kribbella soli]TCC05909.1 hypothetical protein E0H45_28355 [Kribbella soli]